ncbi:MAG: membrane protein insertion efficiency factor YidD [Canibacter sp.]
MFLVDTVLLIPRNVAIAVLKIYRKLISPLYGDVCKYYPSCSRYSVEAYQQRSFFVATVLTAWRLLRCNPWSSGGIDDVPPARHQRTLVTRRGFVRAADRKA